MCSAGRAAKMERSVARSSDMVMVMVMVMEVNGERERTKFGKQYKTFGRHTCNFICCNESNQIITIVSYSLHYVILLQYLHAYSLSCLFINCAPLRDFPNPSAIAIAFVNSMASTSHAPPHPSNFAGQDEHADAINFARALRPPPKHIHTLHHFCPAVSSHTSCLDVLLFRGLLLVVYAAADEVVLARGSDLHAMRRLRCPHTLNSRDRFVTAVAFRERDAAIAAAFGSCIVVFEGWTAGANLRESVYDAKFTEVVLQTSHMLQNPVVSLSWNAEGTVLCAVADAVIVWTIDRISHPVSYVLSLSIPSTHMPALPLALAAMSPDASHLAVSGLYARVAYVWALPTKPLASPASMPCAQVVHGRSGIAALDWKKRGGGNPALMTTDRDGTIRLWVRASSTHTPPVTSSWMEEIARSPHVEHSPRAGATFLAWGGGGGVADDEGDAMATNAAHPLLAEGTAPKPSRCSHWIVRVAGGNASAWRVRGLDDRPRAEFARLEPGSGQPLVGIDDCSDEDFRPPERPLRDASITAIKAVAPIPLTTASQYKIGLVKSYAISNGERRLRSPEPPEPPNVVAIFLLAVRNGVPFLARYDMCPTSTMPAVCRARVGIGHTSPVVDLVLCEQTSSALLSSGRWLASRGESGDVLIWRTNVSTGADESMTAVAALPGPHTAVCFAPQRTSSQHRWEVGVFTCDSALGSLRLFQFANCIDRKDNVLAQDVQHAKQIAICHARGRGVFDAVVQLVVVPLNRTNLDAVTGATCAVFGVRQGGRLGVWYVSRRRVDILSLEPAVIRVLGRRHVAVCCAASNELTSVGRHILVTGSQDGGIFVYFVGQSEMEADVERYRAGDSEDEMEEGVIWLRELCFLRKPEESDGAVVKVQILQGGSRILALYASGRTAVWARNASDSISWNVELSLVHTADLSSKNDESCAASSCTSSIGYDQEGNFSLVVLRQDGSFDRYKRNLGMTWELVQKNEVPWERLPSQNPALVHIGKGVILTSSGRGMSVLGVEKFTSHSLPFVSDAGGYSPSKALMAQIMTGGRAWQASSALEELHIYIRNVVRKKASEMSYSAGRGLIPPPPSLSMLTSDSEDAPGERNVENKNGSNSAVNSYNFALGAGRNLFAELMAKSEKKLANGGEPNENVDAFANGGKPIGSTDLSTLASQLRVVSLAGVTRSEQTVLCTISNSVSSLSSIFTSLDTSGARFALIASCHLELTTKDPIPLSVIASAVHSSSSDALMDHFFPRVTPGQKSSKNVPKLWEKAKMLGAGWWVSTSTGCKTLAERIARADFNSHRNVDDTALWYIALGRKTALSALYRSQHNARMSQFLSRNFSKDENRVAAGKNAYVLVSKHRLELAVAFFILAGNISGALNLVRTRICDDQLAIFLSRILENGDHLNTTLQHIIKSSEETGDDHRKGLAMWLCGKHESALVVASMAHFPHHGAKLSEAERALVGSLPAVVHSLSHVLALSTRPPIRGTNTTRKIVQECRRKAVRALLGDGSPVAALVVSLEIMRADESSSAKHSVRRFSRRIIETTYGSAVTAAIDTLKGRAVCLAGAVRSGALEQSLQKLLMRDVTDLCTSPLGLEGTIQAVEGAAFDLVKEDEVDASLAATCAAVEVVRARKDYKRKLEKVLCCTQRTCLRIAVSRALFNVQGALSLLHHPTLSAQQISELLGKYKAAATHIESAEVIQSSHFKRLVMEFRGAVLSLRFVISFLRGDWPGIWYSLRACELLWQANTSSTIEDASVDREGDDSISMNSACSSLSPDTVSVEALRHVASNPAILSISRSIGHVRRYRKTPSIAMVGESAGQAATISDESIGTPTLSISSNDPYAVIRIHPALSSTLAAASAAYLSAHLAAHAASHMKSTSDESQRPRSKNAQRLLQTRQTRSDMGTELSSSLIKASEMLEHLAEDAIPQWVPLQRFGVEAHSSTMSQPDESAGAFVDLWSTLGCLPEYAPSLSEAATVAAAEMAAAASRAAIEAAEEMDGGKRRRRRREKNGEVVASVAKEGLKLFDTTSADSLYGAYPVRFSSSAGGPWSGRGRHASLYTEEGALFRTLCISATDPPAVIVATPKGVQEIVPSSYTTMPAGFRSHYSSKRGEDENLEDDERLHALENDRRQEALEESKEENDAFLSTYDGFGEGPYVSLDMDEENHVNKRSSHGKGRKAVWRHQVHATTLASHPLRRRFASGGTDGVVRLWDFADPISLASFREGPFGRISDLCFSAYGNTMLAVYSSGFVTLWEDPDVYSSQSRSRSSSCNRTKVIRAFDNRQACGAAFLDERHTIAVVGDHTAPPSVGHSLRIFDTRETNSSFHASWSAAVNHQSEAKCLALLEDRMRVVTGGLDGSLSIVDIRTKACIAELPAHNDQVTCLALEIPRGRALVSGSANGEIKLWDSRTLLQLDVIQEAHRPTRHYWSGNGIGGLVGSYGTNALALTDRSLISCGGDGVVKIWGPGWSDFDLNVL